MGWGAHARRNGVRFPLDAKIHELCPKGAWITSAYLGIWFQFVGIPTRMVDGVDVEGILDQLTLTSPIPAPCTVTDPDPVPARFDPSITLIIPTSSDHACVTLPVSAARCRLELLDVSLASCQMLGVVSSCSMSVGLCARCQSRPFFLFRFDG